MADYIFKGKLAAHICDACTEAVSHATVRLYRHRSDQDAAGLAAAPAKHTFSILPEEQVRAKEKYLIAEAPTDGTGRFEFRLNEKKHDYSGGAFEVDVHMTSMPGRDPQAKPMPVQITITTLKPEWENKDNLMIAPAWEYAIPARYWCHLMAHYDLWVVCGRFVTCKGRVPLPGANVRAFDADWLQHDALGEDTTDVNGRFRIYYTSADFKQTPLSPLINVELTGGPDLFFQVEYGGILVVNERASIGRQPGRENVGHCKCLELCAELDPPAANELPHWERVERLDVDTDISAEGYAGTDSKVMSDCIDLYGNMPLTNVANGKALKYRFLIGAWTWSGGEDPSVLPDRPPADEDLEPVTSIHKTCVGFIDYETPDRGWDSAAVEIRSEDLDGDGCITLLGHVVTVDMHDGTTADIAVTERNFVGYHELIRIDSKAYTPESDKPHTVDNLGLDAAGQPVPDDNRVPVRRYKLRFQVFDSDASPLDKTSANKTLDALVIDNSAPKFALNLQELTGDLCDKITAEIHILYTIDHPHLSDYKVEVENNHDVIHAAPQLPHGEFSGDHFFRGGESNSDPDASHVNVVDDDSCAYAVKLSWQTRHYHSDRNDRRSRQRLYCI